MPNGSPLNELHHNLPSSFFECLVRDIPADTWLQLVKSNPAFRAAILEGFNAPANKLGRLLRQPHIVKRLQRFIRSDPTILEEILLLWGQEQLAIMAFLDMLDRSFILQNWQGLKNFIGPERFFAGLRLLGYLDDKDFQELIGEDFWERQTQIEDLEPLAPLWLVWKDFVQQFPQSANWFENETAVSREPSEATQDEPSQALRQQIHRLEERCSKVQLKLDRAEEEKSQLQQDVTRYRKENEELRKQMVEFEKAYDKRLQEAVAQARTAWFLRYRTIDKAPLDEADGLLDSLLARTQRAFERQRQADEEYGLVAAVRQKFLHVELYLKEIERIYADSLVVHSEVTKAKEALLKAKEKLLGLPGIHKVLNQEPALLSPVDMRRQIRLLDVVPENLPRITEFQRLVKRLDDLGFIENPQPLSEDIEHKKHQIMESLYAQHLTFQEQTSHGRHFQDLDDFVESGESKNYDLYLDGYNILLKLQVRGRSSSSFSLPALREPFIDAVVRKSHYFRKVYLVFDGQEESRDRRGNTEIIYTDKNRGNTADAHIIQALGKSKGRQALLVTGDQEIIQTIGDRLFAVVDPYHFYLFAYDMPFPDLPREANR
jgi:hypothetical protein